MSTPDKCKHCGAEFNDDASVVTPLGRIIAGYWLCGSKTGFKFVIQSDLCLERAAHAETLDIVKRLAEVVVGIQSQFEAVIGRELTPPFLPDDAKEILAELVAERDTAKAQLTREREKWGNLGNFIKSWASNTKCPLIPWDELEFQMNRLDAEANWKDGK